MKNYNCALIKNTVISIKSIGRKIVKTTNAECRNHRDTLTRRGMGNFNYSSITSNCQFVVKRQQIKNHSNLDILGQWSYIIHQMHAIAALGHVKSAGRGVYAHAVKKDFF